MTPYELDLNRAAKAINRFKTGIRKKFRIAGHECQMAVDKFDGRNILMINYENIPFYMEIEDLSAKAVVDAVNLAAISRIMNE